MVEGLWDIEVVCPVIMKNESLILYQHGNNKTVVINVRQVGVLGQRESECLDKVHSMLILNKSTNVFALIFVPQKNTSRNLEKLT